jgi:hypothetical protein
MEKKYHEMSIASIRQTVDVIKVNAPKDQPMMKLHSYDSKQKSGVVIVPDIGEVRFEMENVPMPTLTIEEEEEEEEKPKSKPNHQFSKGIVPTKAEAMWQRKISDVIKMTETPAATPSPYANQGKGALILAHRGKSAAGPLANRVKEAEAAQNTKQDKPGPSPYAGLGKGGYPGFFPSKSSLPPPPDYDEKKDGDRVETILQSILDFGGLDHCMNENEFDLALFNIRAYVNTIEPVKLSIVGRQMHEQINGFTPNNPDFPLMEVLPVIPLDRAQKCRACNHLMDKMDEAVYTIQCIPNQAGVVHPNCMMVLIQYFGREKALNCITRMTKSECRHAKRTQDDVLQMIQEIREMCHMDEDE